MRRRTEGGYEVEVTTKNRRTSPKRRAEWRRQRIEEIVAYAEQVDHVGLMRLRDCAEAFAKKSEQDRAVNARIKDKGGRDQLTVGDIIEISEELNLSPAEVDHYFFERQRGRTSGN